MHSGPRQTNGRAEPATWPPHDPITPGLDRAAGVIAMGCRLDGAEIVESESDGRTIAMTLRVGGRLFRYDVSPVDEAPGDSHPVFDTKNPRADAAAEYERRTRSEIRLAETEGMGIALGHGFGVVGTHEHPVDPND